jgi:hypothetical protein
MRIGKWKEGICFEFHIWGHRTRNHIVNGGNEERGKMSKCRSEEFHFIVLCRITDEANENRRICSCNKSKKIKNKILWKLSPSSLLYLVLLQPYFYRIFIYFVASLSVFISRRWDDKKCTQKARISSMWHAIHLPLAIRISFFKSLTLKVLFFIFFHSFPGSL